jgi:hypothetical protein
MLCNKIKNEMGWACGIMGYRRGEHRVFVQNYEGKRLRGRPKLTWEDNIEMEFQEVKWGRG